MDSNAPKTAQPFFCGLADTHSRPGWDRRPAVDRVLAALLTRFVHCARDLKVRNPAGRRLEEVAEMLIEAEARLADPRREVHRHIGDFPFLDRRLS